MAKTIKNYLDKIEALTSGMEAEDIDTVVSDIDAILENIRGLVEAAENSNNELKDLIDELKKSAYLLDLVDELKPISEKIEEILY